METEPLLPYSTPTISRTRPPLPTLPENNNLSYSLTPSQLKEYLIFGPPTLPPQPHSPSSSNDDWLVYPNIHRSNTAPTIDVINEVNVPTTKRSPQFSSQSVTMQAFLLLMSYLTLGVVIYSCYKEHFIGDKTHPVVDALYFCIVTMCTIGYGDITPATTTAKLFAVFFVLIGLGLVICVLSWHDSFLLRKVVVVLGVVGICIGIGVGFMHFVEGLDWLDSFYLSVMSVTTVGYGNKAFTSMTGRIFASIWLLVSTFVIARVFLYLAEARVEKRHRRFEKNVLEQDTTVSQFIAADIDNHGSISKSEFVIYKLKEMGRVTDNDVLLICQQFDRFDGDNCGKITLADVMEPH